MNEVGLILSMPNALIGHMSTFLNDREQSRLSHCCQRIHSLMEEMCKRYCIKHFPIFSHFLQCQNAQVHSWCQVRHRLLGNPVVFSEHSYSSHIHGWEGRRNEGLTNERRTWIVTQIWAASGLQGTPEDLRSHDQYFICQRQKDGITCYKIPHRVDACYHGLETESGKITVSSTLRHHQWKPIKLTVAPDKEPGRFHEKVLI